MMIPRFEQGDALVVVDVQNDFCPGGALAVPEGDAVVPVLNDAIDATVAVGVPVVASRDWHPAGHCSFAEQGGPWPEHCVQETPGAQFHPDLRLPYRHHRVSKGQRMERDQYSALDDTALGDWLREQGIRRLWVGGLAQDVCVQATVLDACQEGFDVCLIRAATRPVTTEGGQQALEAMKAEGADIV